MPVVSNIKLKLLGVAMLNFCIRAVCLLTASLMAAHALSQDMRGWSDKTVCRLLLSKPDEPAYVEELDSRGLSCVSNQKNTIKLVPNEITQVRNSCSHENKKYRNKRIKYCVFSSSLELDQFLKNTDKIYVDFSLIIRGPGVFDFQNKSIFYSGFNKKCRKSRSGRDPFIFIESAAGAEVIIKNLTIRRSSPDGVLVPDGVNVKFVNLNIMHSCDEGIEVQRGANIEVIDSLIVSQFNKGIMFKADNKAKIINSTILSEQAFSLQYDNLTVEVSDSTIKKHPQAQDGRLITGENCKDISIYLTRTTISGLQQLNGSKNCSNIVIVRK